MTIRAGIVGAVLCALAVGCTPKTPQECVDALDGLKKAGMAGPDGYADPKVQQLIFAARTHADDTDPVCQQANHWADDAERARPKHVTVAPPIVGLAQPGSGPHGPSTSGDPSTFSHAHQDCDRKCETDYVNCAQSRGCSGTAIHTPSGQTKTTLDCSSQLQLNETQKACDLQGCYEKCSSL